MFTLTNKHYNFIQIRIQLLDLPTNLSFSKVARRNTSCLEGKWLVAAANIKQKFPARWWCFSLRWSPEQGHPNMIFFGGFCREYEGEYFYDGNLSKNNFWWSISNNKDGGLKTQNISDKKKINDEIEKEEMMNIIYFVW